MIDDFDIHRDIGYYFNVFLVDNFDDNSVLDTNVGSAYCFDELSCSKATV